MKNIQEKFIQPRNGWLMLFVSILGFMAGIALPIIFTESLGWAPVWYFLLIVTVFSFIAMFGLMVINPNESKVITFLENMWEPWWITDSSWSIHSWSRKPYR